MRSPICFPEQLHESIHSPNCSNSFRFPFVSNPCAAAVRCDRISQVHPPVMAISVFLAPYLRDHFYFLLWHTGVRVGSLTWDNMKAGGGVYPGEIYPSMGHEILGQLRRTAWGIETVPRVSHGGNSIGYAVQMHCHWLLGTYRIDDQGSRFVR